MLEDWQQECRQTWLHASLWLAPIGVGAIFLLLCGMMLGSGIEARESMLVFLPILWGFVILSSVGQGLPIFQEEAFFLCYSTRRGSLSVLYQKQLLLLSFALWLGLSILAFLSVLFFGLTIALLGVQLLVLSLVVPSFLALGHLINSLLPNKSSGSVLLSFLLFPLYIPILILSALALQAAWAQMPFMPYCALLLAIQMVLWVFVPPLLIFSTRLRL